MQSFLERPALCSIQRLAHAGHKLEETRMPGKHRHK